MARDMPPPSSPKEAESLLPPSMPPSSSSWKFWYKFWRWPAAFVIVNVVVLMKGIDYSQTSRRCRGAIYACDENVAVLKYNCLVIAILCLCNAIVLYRAASFTKQDVAASRDADASSDEDQSSNKNDNSTTSDDNVHGQVSRKMDHFLGRLGHPRVSIFVSLLFLASVMNCATSLTTLTFWGLAETDKAKKLCTPRQSQNNNTTTSQAKASTTSQGLLPDTFKKRLKWDEYDGSREFRTSWDSDGAGSFAHMVDGTTYFAGRDYKEEQQDREENPEDEVYRPLILVSTGPDGRIQSFPNVSRPRMMTVVRGTSNLASEAFCCLFSDPNKTRATTKAMCLFSSEDVSRGFRNITLPEPKGVIYDNWATSHEEEFWYDITWSNHHDSGRLGGGGEDQIRAFYKIRPETMQVVSVLNVTTMDDSDSMLVFADDACHFWVQVIVCAVVSSVFFPACFWLLVVHQDQAGVALACFAFLAILYCTHKHQAQVLSFLAPVAGTILLLGISPHWKYRESLVWALYVTLAFFSVVRTLPRLLYEGLPLGDFAIGIALGLVLNHPVLQCFGWFVGVLAICFGIYYPVMFPYLFMFGCIFGFGFVGAGDKYNKHYDFVLFHLKRLWRGANQSLHGVEHDE